MDYNIHIPVGFKFHPTEEELISHYLKPKLEGDDINIIPEIELSNVEPCDIPALSLIKTDKPEWFFFSPIPLGSKQLRRATRFGYWKSHGHDSVVNETGTNNVIGYKKILAFYEGRRNRKNETIINWVMYEYHAAATSEYAHQRSFVLCHLMKNADRKTQWGTGALTCDKGETSRRAISDCKNKPVEEGIPNVHGLLPEVNTDSIVPTWHQEQSYNANPRNENSSRQTPFEYTEGIKDVRAGGSRSIHDRHIKN
ncbi:protein NTM1-like 9 [Lotus japonicus]|uniref:protein NTM1-like 9 n=1 Tax=Lotus japonicus TaxID=34305 RepID=UPI00258BE234|nr:protein NTM1-like 9 [Lotus japonicus]